MVAMLIFAGLRREELLWLTKKDVDLKKRIIYVRANKINQEEWQPKTRRSNRAVLISNTLHHYLDSYVAPTDTVWYFPSPS
jgi:integrase